MEPIRRRVGAVLLALLVLGLAGPVWSQTGSTFPAAGWPDPEAGGALPTAVQTLLGNAMKRLPPGQPPFGTDAAGNPAWPMQDPAAAQSRTNPPPQAGPDSFSSTGSGGGDTPNGLVEKLSSLPGRGTATGEELRSQLETVLTAETGNSGGRPVLTWSSQRVVRMKYAFLNDLQRHARFVFEGKNELALAVALKWQVIGQLHRSQIDAVTLDIARRQGAASFEAWIEGIVRADRSSVP